MLRPTVYGVVGIDHAKFAGDHRPLVSPAEYFSQAPRTISASCSCCKRAPRFILVDASSTNQKYTGRSPSICTISLSARSSMSAGLKTSISTLQARTRIASLWLEKRGTRKLNFSSRANQSPLARCIPYMLLIADLVLERDQDRLLRGGGEVMCISSFLS